MLICNYKILRTKGNLYNIGGVVMDCGFQNGDRWFRYRATEIIIEDGHVLFAKNELDPYYYAIGGGVKNYAVTVILWVYGNICNGYQ